MADVVTLVKQGHTHSTRTLIKIDQNVTRLQEQVGSANLSLDKFTATCQVLGKRVTSFASLPLLADLQYQETGPHVWLRPAQSAHL